MTRSLNPPNSLLGFCRLEHRQQHDDGCFGVDAVGQICGHVSPGSRSGFIGFPAEGEARFTLENMNDGGHGGRVLRKLLAGIEAEEDGARVLVRVNSAADDPILGYVDLGQQVGNVFKVHSFSARS